jgi:hypothetical protein
MAKEDPRTLTNEPDPADFGKARPKRIRTQIHRRSRSAEPLTDQWDSASGEPPEDLRMPADKMPRRNPPESQ